MHFADLIVVSLFCFVLAGCGSVIDDLYPSSADKRSSFQSGTTGPAVGQNAPDFTLATSLGSTMSMSAALGTSQGMVLYFTMWCPICDMHMSKIRSEMVPVYPELRFFLIDYVSGSIAAVREAEVSNGYAGNYFTVLADTAQSVLGAYGATMGTTVVIDSAGVIRMNEDFKDGARLVDVLESLP